MCVKQIFIVQLTNTNQRNDSEARQNLQWLVLKDKPTTLIISNHLHLHFLISFTKLGENYS
jgi:hypothetical protein